MEKEIKQCEHLFESRRIKVQKRNREYISDGNWDIVTLEREEHYIFCNRCGETKSINLK